MSIRDEHLEDCYHVCTRFSYKLRNRDKENVIQDNCLIKSEAVEAGEECSALDYVAISQSTSRCGYGPTPQEAYIALLLDILEALKYLTGEYYAAEGHSEKDDPKIGVPLEDDEINDILNNRRASRLFDRNAINGKSPEQDEVLGRVGRIAKVSVPDQVEGVNPGETIKMKALLGSGA